MEKLEEDVLKWVRFIAIIGDNIAEFTGINAARAILRAAGRKFVKTSVEKVDDPIKTAIAEIKKLGLFEDVTPGEKGEYLIKNCKLAEYLEANSQKPGEHPVCYFSFGLIEGCLREVGIDSNVQFRERKENVCVEKWHD